MSFFSTLLSDMDNANEFIDWFRHESPLALKVEGHYER
jgi:hypothetical protein